MLLQWVVQKVHCRYSIEYAKTREQFKTAIANFGAIKHKLAEMAIQYLGCESALYRTAKWIDEKKQELLACRQTI